MSPLPSAEQDLVDLERFLAREAPRSLAGNPAFLDIRQRAERLAIRLANPVRVAILGIPGTGKSSLAGFLAGMQYDPPRNADRASLPVILRFGERPSSLAGWWSGIEIPLSGVDLEGAAVHRPDYVELRLPNPVLQSLSFLDLPGVSEWDAQKEQMRWVTGRADVLIWCTDARDPWTNDEWQLWALVPKRLQARSLLVATHRDTPEAARLSPSAEERLAKLRRTQFLDVAPMSTLDALVAAPSGRVVDAGLWDRSGARAMIASLITAARAVRAADIAASRELLAAGNAVLAALAGEPDERAAALEEAVRRPISVPPPQAAPARPATSAPPPAPPEEEPPPAPAAGREEPAAPAARPAPFPLTPAQRPAETPAADEAAPPESPAAPPEPAAATDSPAPARTAIVFPPKPAPVAPAPAEDAAADAAPAKPAPVVAYLADELAKLLAYVEKESAFKDWEYMTKVTEISDELMSRTQGKAALTPEGEWVRGQVDEALVTLSLLAMEHGARPAEDAATVLLQLARDLSWAATREEAA